MNKYFYIKRTKMIDEAAQFHRPTPLYISVLIFLLVYYASSFAAALIQIFPMLGVMFSNPAFDAVLESDAPLEAFMSFMENFSYPGWFMIVDLVSRFGIIVVCVLYCKTFEKRSIRSMGIRKGNALPEYLVGLVIGFAIFFLTFFFAWLFGGVEISVNPEGVSWILILYFLGFVIQGAAEEFLVRGYFMVSVARDYKVFFAIITSSLVFAFIHIFNTGMTVIAFLNIFLVGVFFAIYVFKRGNLWGACAIHTMWNFAQGNVFGISVSGLELMPSIFTVTNNEGTAMWLLNGDVFGLEGSLCCTFVMLGAIALALLLKTKRTEISYMEQGYIPSPKKHLWET
ncbi:MAG: CPBP family intramembrane metalloprotease [Clostridia bacterium]|nr:CPBP family intramembrane metalloprotease [Clostridia bacterium]